MANWFVEASNRILSFEMLFSLAVLGLIINLVLIVRIKFGSQIITSLTMKPYLISFALFSIMAIEFLCISFMH